MPLYNLRIHKKSAEQWESHKFVEGIVFTHPDGRMAKLRRNMFDWFKGESNHRKNNKNEI